MKQFSIFILFFSQALFAQVAIPKKMICSEKSLAGYSYQFPRRNIEIYFKDNVDSNVKRYNVSFIDNHRRDFDVTDWYYFRNTSYWINYESGGISRPYVFKQCGSSLNDGERYHFLIAGGDYGPIMCLSCSE